MQKHGVRVLLTMLSGFPLVQSLDFFLNQPPTPTPPCKMFNVLAFKLLKLSALHIFLLLAIMGIVKYLVTGLTRQSGRKSPPSPLSLAFPGPLAE